jgi:DNA-binding SARP family transcriptional activator
VRLDIVSSVVEFRILGPLEVVNGGQVLRLAGARPPAILAILLLHANRPVTVEQLAGAWPNPPAALGSNVRTHIAALRRAFASAGEPTSRLTTVPAGYQIEARPGELDLISFESLVEEGEKTLAEGDHVTAEDRFGRALRLWRGAALEGLAGGPLLDAEVARLAERRLRTVERWADAAFAIGEYQRVADELAQLVRSEPLREQLWARLMLALYRSGRQADALAAYQRLYKLLDKDLGVQPSQALQELHRRILGADPMLENAPRQAAAAVAAPVPVRQLPPDIAHFTGRDTELAWLENVRHDLLEGRPTAVVISAIAGTAGVGKTALAVHWAHKIAKDFPDGQLYVNLRGYDPAEPLSPLPVLDGFLRELGVDPRSIPPSLEERSALFRSTLAGRRMLVLLDNARSADQVRPLLPGTAGCLVLVTSRDDMAGLVARNGAHRLALDRLPVPAAVELLRRVIGTEVVDAEPAAAAELARRCAGLPLALRVAATLAARRAGSPLAAVSVELEDPAQRLEALGLPQDPASAIREVISWSYRQLPDVAARLFRLLGLHPGPDIGIQSAAKLADTGPRRARRLLEQLSDAHLIEPTTTGRYHMHDLLRAYARERAVAEETEPDRHAAAERLYGHYLRAVDAAAKLLYPQMLRLPAADSSTTTDMAVEGEQTDSGVAFTDAAEAINWLDSERSNLVAAATSAASGGPRAAAWRLADALRGYFFLRMFAWDWLTVARAGLVAAQTDGDRQGQAALHLSLATYYWAQSRPQETIDHCALAHELAHAAGWVDGQAAALGTLASAHRLEGRLKLAAEYLNRTVVLQERTGRAGGRAASHLNLGTVCMELGRLADALHHDEQALVLYRKIGSYSGESNALACVGELHHLLGRSADALNELRLALSLLQEIGDRNNEAETLRCLAAVYRDTGQLATALDTAQRAAARARNTGHRRLEADVLNTLGTILRRLGHLPRSIERHDEALLLASDAASPYSETESLLGLASAYRGVDRYDEALSYADKALGMARSGGFRALEGQALTELSAIHYATGELKETREYGRRALAVHQETGHRLGEARTLLLLGHSADHVEESTVQLRDAHALFAAIGVPEAEEEGVLLRPA